ncbi:MAG: hypothetical protein QW117_02230 [Candidatus Pacearchaeota archaeon]
MKKRAAIELSIGTIVIIVLAMTMLIMGLVLIKTIFSGARYNVDTINDKVKEQINKMFSEDDSNPIITYLANNKATVKRGNEFGVAIGIKNLDSGNQASKFKYEVKLGEDSSELKKQCGITEKEAMELILKGKTDEFTIRPGDYSYGLIRIVTEKESPICMIRYRIELYKNGQPYASTFFDLEIK